MIYFILFSLTQFEVRVLIGNMKIEPKEKPSVSMMRSIYTVPAEWKALAVLAAQRDTSTAQLAREFIQKELRRLKLI